jgi:phospholipase C
MFGDLLNAAGVTWGFFDEGFDTSVVNTNGTTGCRRSNWSGVTGQTPLDYAPVVNPFQYLLRPPIRFMRGPRRFQ